jgi:Asp-tRNA(Asn)/Glu-tRNA(Gln) amidotransferase A subunit family amidase
VLTAFITLLESSRLVRQSLLRLNNMNVLQNQDYSETPSLLPFPSPAHADSERQKQIQRSLVKNDADLLAQGVSDVGCYIRNYQTRTTSPSELAQSLLKHIQESNEGPEPLNAVLAVDEEGLMQEAIASSKRYEQGQPLSPLDGIPIVVKSEIFVQNLPSQAGTSFLEVPAGHPEATVISRLRKAGALIVGVTNMHEIGIGVTGANIHYGAARNPYDTKRITGGSSSGSAAAVAAGLVPLAIGTDGGGSIRIPSSLCGVVGLKPSFSRLSSYGLFPSSVSVCQAGPIARYAVDCALAYQIMAGPDPLDGKTYPQPPPSLRDLDRFEDLSDLTAGIYSPWFEHADPDIVAICNEFLLILQKRGLKVVEVEIPELEEARVAHFITIVSEMFSFMKGNLAEHRAELASTTRFALALASELTANDYLQALKFRQKSMNQLDEIFKKVDLIVSPACATTAALIPGNASHRDTLDTVLMSRLMRFAQLFNLTGHPAISFPAGYTTRGLPVGIQFAAQWWAEADLLRVARAGDKMIERQRPGKFWGQ